MSVTYEKVIKKWFRGPYGPYIAIPVFELSTGELLSEDQYNDYYKQNETENHHLGLFEMNFNREGT